MKFCKNLQRVVDISDPEWAPYWTNYKMLKKLIKELPSLVPTEESGSRATTSTARGRQIHAGDRTKESHKRQNSETSVGDSQEAIAHSKEELGKSPGEIAFFKLLHAELKKAEHFFEKAQQEFIIREERVWEGMEIMKQPNSIMVNEKWSLLAKSIYRLYKELLLLETFAIMTYCAFSKILKKHDKVTGYITRQAFMANVVSKANFTNYPKVLEMISRCEQMYEEVSQRLLQEGKHGLYEDERLFINMVSRLNEQAMDAASQEGAPNNRGSEAPRRSVPVAAAADAAFIAPAPGQPPSKGAIASLQELVEENDARAAAQVSEGLMDDDDDRKRPAETVETGPTAAKRSKK